MGKIILNDDQAFLMSSSFFSFFNCGAGCLNFEPLVQSYSKNVKMFFLCSEILYHYSDIPFFF